MKTELKPCPFCGNANLSVIPDDEESPNVYAVWCDGCGNAAHWSETEDLAIAAWNRRAGEEES